LKARKAEKNGSNAGTTGKEGQSSGKGSGRGRNGQDKDSGKSEVDHKQTKSGSGGKAGKPGAGSQKGKGTQWKNLYSALQGVLQTDIDAHKKDNPDGCWRCGNPNHRSVDCYAGHTKSGAELPRPAGNSASNATKRKRSEDEEEDCPGPEIKRENISAIRVEDEDMREAPVWAVQSDSEVDFY
jgi:hypothetical protein